MGVAPTGAVQPVYAPPTIRRPSAVRSHRLRTGDSHPPHTHLHEHRLDLRLAARHRAWDRPDAASTDRIRSLRCHQLRSVRGVRVSLRAADLPELRSSWRSAVA